ncbi:DUF2065 domain-containing protein [Yunchengibacter salinarum]|uniref:DUF2065 domain-containing protein n=1 Tax=Yunchengibacter salinarum TaxID=3133399 RepID=UPI0035B5A93B
MDWSLFLSALGLALFMEGVFYTLLAGRLKVLVVALLQQPVASIRLAGLTTAVIGVAIVWLARGG